MEEKILQKKINQLKKEYGFSKKYGFLNIKEKRCGLPRYLRSRTCLNFYCHEAISRCNGTGINDICDKMTKIRIKNKLLI